MSDIIVTTPKTKSRDAAREAENAKALNDYERQYYFRKLGKHEPRDFGAGSRVYYVENGYIRGFCVVEDDEDIVQRVGQQCSTTGEYYSSGLYVYMPADSWTWVVPIPMRGFQGWCYARFSRDEVVEVGDWQDERPDSTISKRGLTT